MKLSIVHQESYSRLELILRTLFGAFYIILPHFLISLWGSILSFIAFRVVLFTGRYPESMFEYQVQLLRWQIRVNARMSNLADDYPSFGLTAKDDHVSLEVPYPESISRGLLLLRVFFGVVYSIVYQKISSKLARIFGRNHSLEYKSNPLYVVYDRRLSSIF
jgi:pilus assembly protein TadC